MLLKDAELLLGERRSHALRFALCVGCKRRDGGDWRRLARRGGGGWRRSARRLLTFLAVHKLHVVLHAEQLVVLKRKFLAGAELPLAMIASETGEMINERSRAPHPIGRLNLALAENARDKNAVELIDDGDRAKSNEQFLIVFLFSHYKLPLTSARISVENFCKR